MTKVSASLGTRKMHKKSHNGPRAANVADPWRNRSLRTVSHAVGPKANGMELCYQSPVYFPLRVLEALVSNCSQLGGFKSYLLLKYSILKFMNFHSGLVVTEALYLVTALVPSDTACFESSPGSNNLTAV